jgi:glycosyltransferase involved in cell wall biosynthesis
MFMARSLRYFPPVWNEARCLAARGWQVRIYTIADRGDYGESPAPTAGVSVEVIPLLTRALPGGLLMGAKFLELFVREVRAASQWRADLCVAHDLPALPQAFAVAARAKAAVVYRAHELWTERKRVPGRRLWRWVERTLAPRADLIVVPTRERAEFLQGRFRLSEPPLVVMNCPETRTCESNEVLSALLSNCGHAPAGRKVVLYQGTVAASRCILELVAAAEKLPATVLVVLMGPVDNRLRPALKAALARAGPRVALLPPASRDVLWSALCASDAGVALYRPDSLNNRLCAPNKIFEYMMAGIPIIGSHTPGIARFIEEQALGVLVDPEDPADIARGMMIALDNPEREHLRARAMALAATTYHWDVQFEPLFQAYCRLLPRPFRHGPRGD